MSRDDRVHGLDSIRFVLACWVAVGHNGLFPLFEGMDGSSRLVWLVKGLYGASVSGPAAVIAFFVISGFCIHFPYRNGERLRPLQYYPRRYLRILAPLGAAVGIAHWLGTELDSVLWSIVCEEIYYLLYPLILRLQKKCGWGALLAVSFTAGVAVAWTNPTALEYPSYGWQLNWILGLPCWLLGCLLAQGSDALYAPVSGRAIWGWRFAVWIASCACLGLRCHSPIGYPHTLNYFGVLTYFWLQREIRYYRGVKPPRRTEWAGKWSYSLYLIHRPANAVYGSLQIPNFGFVLNWAIRFGWVLACSYGFYVVAEWPSHTLARRLGKRLAQDDKRNDKETTTDAGKADPISTEPGAVSLPPHPSLAACPGSVRDR